MALSRRKRRRLLKSEAPFSLRKWLWRIAALLVLLFVLALAGTYFYILSFLKSDELRDSIEEKAGEALQANVYISPIHRDGKYLRVDNVTVQSPENILKNIGGEGVDVEINYRKLWDRTLLLNRIRVKTITMELGNLPLSVPDTVRGSEVVGEEDMEETGLAAYLPNKFEFGELSVNEFNLSSDSPEGSVSLQGTTLQVEALGANGYRINLNGGKFAIPWDLFPHGELEMATGRLINNHISVTELKAKVGEKGRLALDGTWSLKDAPSDLNMALRSVPLSDILPPDWLKSVSGELSAYCKIKRDAEKKFTYQGDISINNGILTALPFLDTLAAFTATSRFRHIDWTTATAEYKYDGSQWIINNILLASDGLIRIEGDITITGEDLAGTLMIGVPAGLLSHIPGAEETIFRPGKAGLLWAPVTLSGTINNPKESLSSQLVKAAGDRLFRFIPGGQKVLNYTRSIADQLLDQMSPGGEKAEKDEEKKSDIKVGQDLLRSGLEMGIELLAPQ